MGPQEQLVPSSQIPKGQITPCDGGHLAPDADLPQSGPQGTPGSHCLSPLTEPLQALTAGIESATTGEKWVQLPQPLGKIQAGARCALLLPLPLMLHLTLVLETGASSVSMTGSPSPLRKPLHNPASHLPEAYRSCVGFPITALIKSGPRGYLFLLFQASMFGSSSHTQACSTCKRLEVPLDITLPAGDVSLQALSAGVMPENPKEEEPAELPFREEMVFPLPQ